jgi:malate dehydrogenase
MSLPKTPIKVCITGAAGAIGGYAAFMVAQGVMLGQDQPIELRLLEV